jgi:3D (Asp-Asp-Asp) domain-containing protein
MRLSLALTLPLILWAPSIGGAGKRAPQKTMAVSATAYCQAGRTATGDRTRPGIVAADPRVLPLGTVVRIIGTEYRGSYKVLDVGSAVKGRTIDIFMPSCRDAKRFGRQRVHLEVLAN